MKTTRLPLIAVVCLVAGAALAARPGKAPVKLEKPLAETFAELLPQMAAEKGNRNEAEQRWQEMLLHARRPRQ